MAMPVQIPQVKEILVDTTGAEIVEEQSPATRDSRGIYLPHYIEPVSHIAIDIGGSLAKVVYFTRSPNPPNGHSRVAGLKTGLNALSLDNQAVGDESLYSAGLTEGTRNEETNGVPIQHSAQDTSSRSNEAEGSSWTPIIDGALTPQLLEHERIFDLERFKGDLERGHRREFSTESTSEADPDVTPTVTSSQPDRATTRRTRGSRGVKGRTGHPRGHSLLRRSSLPPNFPGGTLNFARFETEKIYELVDFLKTLISTSATTNQVTEEEMKKGIKIIATGGGAHKYYDLLTEELGIGVSREDEMECLITGLGFITCIPDEVFWYSDQLVYEISHQTHDGIPPAITENGDATPAEQPKDLPRPSPNPPAYQVTFDTSGTPQFPCLLVNIGSGVSIVKVDEDGSFERVSGTSLGGGTLWGLLSLMTDATTFDEMLALSDKGDNAAVDMLVGDIYGSDYSKVGLKSSTIASSFGKVFKKGASGRKRSFRQEDISKSLLYAISNNIGQIAYMNAEKYGLDRIYFGGCFIRGHASTISCLSYAIRFWSRGTVKAMFLRHEGFLGSIGAWIKNVGQSPSPRSPTSSVKA
ncbi:hypothetical protein NliqN6_3592 [Naganishia liquefaciens]|uniref:Pantothenate kinase n=1 Tax=Naganishia liquefaciens TaxID=104408 RepID=A0A8H3YF11_9TREE|nr:hypothetical protein NliqN6_3592 [Naganishia liquefaciens]